MIVKAGPDLRGGRTHGLLSYLLGPGRHTVHTDPRVIGGWLPLNQLPDADLDPTGRVDYIERIDINGTVRRYPKVTRLVAALDAPVKAVSETRRPSKHVWHCIVSNDPKVDPVLSDQQWAAIADEIVASVGLRECRWVAVRHDDHGIHIAATLIDENGRRPRLSFEKTKLNQCRTRLEAQHCRRRTDPGTRTGGVAYQRHEVEKARREGRPAPARTMLRRALNTAVMATDNPAAFRAFLTRQGVQVGWRFSTVNPGEITGYKVALAGHTTATGEPVWYKASDVDRALTWPKIQARWACPRSDDPTRPAAAIGNDYAARTALTASKLRTDPRSATHLQGPVGDLAAALAHTRADLETSSGDWEQFLDNTYWTGRSHAGARGRRYNHTAAGLTAAARCLLVMQRQGNSAVLVWCAVAAQLADTLNALADAHAAADRRRQAEQATQAARHLAAAVAEARTPPSPPALGTTTSLASQTTPVHDTRRTR